MKHLLALLCVVAVGCVAETAAPDDVSVDTEAISQCWDTSVAGSQSGFPPFDVMTAVVAMKQWAGGSWKACTCTPNLTDCTCPRLIGAGRATSHWVGFIGSTPRITTLNYPDGSNNVDREQAIWPSDWDDDVFYHASTEEFVMGDHAGSITVTLQSAASNVWLVHHCQNN